MLVTFQCKAHANVVLFGDVALSLLTWMGHSRTIPGALLAKDVAAARGCLHKAMDQARQQNTPVQEHNVSLVHRALPLLALLQAAEKEDCDVIWESGAKLS